MKITLIYTKKDENISNRLKPIIGTTDIPTEAFLIESEEPSKKDTRDFAGIFGSASEESRADIPTHVVILSRLSKRWYDFLAGFACGSRLPFLVYGEEVVLHVPEEYVFCFTPLKTEPALQQFIDAENEVYKKQEAARVILKAQETLLKMGVPVNGESLCQCAGEGGVQEVSLFLAAGFSPDTRNKAGVPLLNIAAREGKRDILKLLLKSGAQLNAHAEDRGTSAVLDCVMSSHYEMVDELINAGADLNIKSKDGQTALVVAVGAGNEKMTEVLLKAGADADIADSLGVSGRKYAVLFHKKTMMDLFDRYAPQKTPGA